MDQLTVAIAKANHALVLDCRDLTTSYVRIPDEMAIVLCDSRMERRLASSGYNERRSECQNAARMIGVESLRDASLSQIEALPYPLRRRARHVVTENMRTVAAAEARRANDLAALGELMNDSLRSMRDDFDIVPPQLDSPRCCGSEHPRVFRCQDDRRWVRRRRPSTWYLATQSRWSG